MNLGAPAEPELCLSKNFLLHDVPEPVAPLVLASPHSGRSYPEAFLKQSRLDMISLRSSEDAYVDRLFEAAPALGVPLLCADFPRSYCDVNRYAWELDQGMFRERLPEGSQTNTVKVRNGLGMIARIAGSGRGIYRHQLPVSEARNRIASCWLPYHEALQAMIDRCKARFGVCLFIDLHSMPSLPHMRLPDIVLGDLHGKSCARPVVDRVAACLMAQYFSVGRNRPYAGGYITSRHGAPSENVHVIQMEIGRGLYLDEQAVKLSAGFPALQKRCESFLLEAIGVARALVPDGAGFSPR
ncbi:N-formylglutamate amidohydrolase [Asaia prunellae]|uniref:N-formylglutamate amidohydrolase n=1 Tax=Asaia prunellae TaxID=610245 RepID=UPI000471B56B|nr:N-formylglutamate amidohydrolase [Asaia prunellae]